MVFGFPITDYGFRISNFRLWVTVFGLRISDYGFQILDYGFRITDFGLRFSNYGFWITVFELRILDFEVWKSEIVCETKDHLFKKVKLLFDIFTNTFSHTGCFVCNKLRRVQFTVYVHVSLLLVSFVLYERPILKDEPKPHKFACSGRLSTQA